MSGFTFRSVALMLSKCIALRIRDGQVLLWTILASRLRGMAGGQFPGAKSFVTPSQSTIICEARNLSKRPGTWRSGLIAATTGCAVLMCFTSANGETPLPRETPAQTSADAGLDAEEKEGIIFERQQIMLELDADTKLLGAIVAGSEPASKLAETTRSIAENAKASVAAFEPVVPGGRSKSAVWNDHPAFMKDMKLFAQNADAMATAGEQGDVNSVVNLMIDALPCKQCHDRYREPKTS
ncbi:MAG: cytochrome c [Novosphingobium sp.]|nr:cytochrome c [Novosphingobium sp.]